MHRAKIAQLRVRMEGWRQRRPGSNARNPQEGKTKQKEKNTLDSYRPSHGRSYGWHTDALPPLPTGFLCCLMGPLLQVREYNRFVRSTLHRRVAVLVSLKYSR